MTGAKHLLGMKKTHLASAALLALALAACNWTAEPNAVAIENDAASPALGVVAGGPNALNSTTAAAENAATEAGNAATPAKLPTQIPAQFHGRWGLNRADCTSTRGDAKGLLTIGDARLTFYESRGTINNVLGATADSFDARYGFVGEGQTWMRTERLKLVNDMLQRQTDAEPGQEPPVNLTYQRCGA